MPSKLGTDETGSGASHSTTPPPRGSRDHTIGLGIGLALNGSQSPPYKWTKMVTFIPLKQQAMTAEELEETWKAAWELQKIQLKAAFAAIEALHELLEVQKIDSQTTKTKLEQKVRELEEMVEVKEKERARLKEESVGRGWGIAVMRGTVSKMKGRWR